MFLINSRLGLFTAATSPWLPFSRSYGVVLPSSLTRVLPFVLEFSSRLPVSVCGTGTSGLFSSFSRQRGFICFASLVRSPSALRLTTGVLHSLPALRLGRTFPSVGGTGISTCCPSSTPFGLDLGPDLPWADEPSPGNLRLSTGRFLASLSLLMPAFSLLCSPPPLPIRLLPAYIAPLPIRNAYPQASVSGLSPGNLRRTITRPVSYYALF